ncbi:DUF1566 domain-containing protein [Vandammella animalimorsus]|uniref:Fimbrial protein FimH n=1 Tax=Vandammella animalimorsus TaxID=2029117 RepID=A0A2A2ADS4_9BURK|nr:DUF1566 domain-containing protein [Vandammella animalimorsus]PAT35902.1 fimbrial protein FimH [Vandammella animalimorsus]
MASEKNHRNLLFKNDGEFMRKLFSASSGHLTMVALIAIFAATPVFSACPSDTFNRFIPNEAEVTDTGTGLIWGRCAVGQVWNGTTCTGVPNLMTHDEALQYAKNLANQWRLPNIKELSSLVDEGCSFPSINKNIFPQTPPIEFWSSTPGNFGYSELAWYVNFEYGNASGDERSIKTAVRLVRSGP